MGAQVHNVEYTSTVTAGRLFKALIIDSDNLIPKIAPKAIKKVEILEGDGGPGTIKKITFGKGASFGHVTHRVDSIDQENLSYTYSLIEGDVLTTNISKIEYEIKLVETAEGSLIKSVSKYHTLGENNNLVDQINAGKEKALQLFKLIEAYLKDHPDLYN